MDIPTVQRIEWLNVFHPQSLEEADTKNARQKDRQTLARTDYEYVSKEE